MVTRDPTPMNIPASQTPLRRTSRPPGFRVGTCFAALAATAVLHAQPDRSRPALPSESPLTVEELTSRARDSVVVVTVLGRDNSEEGVGSGFVVAEDGLIATALHVLGEARPILVRLTDGRKFEVTTVHAWDRKADLALLRIDVDGLPVLPLGNSDELRQGAHVMAIGNPQGLEHSVVQGIVSAMRDTETGRMIQLAIPLEPGNSGGPLLDMHGRVQGVLTMKSAVTDNLGFAMPINVLQPLLDSPNSVPMERWLTIGRLDPGTWTPHFGARWTQRAGRMRVEGSGKGFGGRSLCLYEKEKPKVPYELAVTVKLDDESGAAGLVFASDGGDRHYGFYPTAGRLRLTRFDGPNVFTWHPLVERSTGHYRPGDWNTLKVRVEKNRILCYVNDHLVFESADDAMRSGQVGLAKFRDTRASFKGFQVGRTVPPSAPPADVVASIRSRIESLPGAAAPDRKLVESFQPQAGAAQVVLVEEAKHLEQRAAQLRQLGAAIHERSVVEEMIRLFKQGEPNIDLFHAALLVARLDDPELDLTHYRQQFDTMAGDLRKRLPRGATPQHKLELLREYLFEENGFHGSRSDYHNPANSYINQVLDDREGIPITLSIVFMELARRIGVDEVVGIPLPGHFAVQHLPKSGPTQLFDVFDGGKPLSIIEAAELVRLNTGRNLKDADLLPATKRSIITRMLYNLVDISLKKEALSDAVRYLSLMLAITPDAGYERWSRGMLRLRTNDIAGAREDFEWLLDHQPAGVDLERVLEVYRRL
jgi:serine protease Do